MKQYDPDLPVFMIHIPKTGGVSVRECIKDWFGDRLLLHYYDALNGNMPAKYDLARLHTREAPVMLYGHFNRERRFGIQDYYPEASQFITILRDPFEQMISGYYYVRRVSTAWKDQSRVPKGEIREFLRDTPSRMMDLFPTEVTMENYQEVIEENFIEVGITEHLDESLRRIAAKLDKPYDSRALKHLNASDRGENVPYGLKEEFMAKNPLTYAVYNYALSKYETTSNTATGSSHG